MVPYFNKSRQAIFLIFMDIIKLMQLRVFFGSLLPDGSLRTRRGSAGAGAASAAVFLASNISNFMLVLCASFQFCKELALRAARARVHCGSECIGRSCGGAGGAARAAVAADAAVAGGALRGATQALWAPLRRFGLPAAAGARRRSAGAGRRSAGALCGADSLPPASRASVSAPPPPALPPHVRRRRLPGVGTFPAEALASAETHQNFTSPAFLPSLGAV